MASKPTRAVDINEVSSIDDRLRLVLVDGVVVGLRPLFVTKEVAAQVLGCSLSLVNGYIRLRMLPVSYHGTKPVVALRELEKFAARLPTEPRTLGL